MKLRAASRWVLACSLAVSTTVTVRAQAAPPQAPRPSQTAPRDPGVVAQNAAGTAVVRGRIVAAEDDRPLRRVRVTLTAPSLPREGISTSTDADGRYEFTGLPAARFTLAVQRNGYLPMRYGQRRPLEQGKPLDVADGQLLEKIDFALPRMAAISGRVFDEVGEPIAGVWVSAMRLVYMNNQRRWANAGQIATTDEAGDYRISGLAPGTYVVMAKTLQKWTVDTRGREQTMGYAPTYFPSVANSSQAVRLTLTSGQEARTTDVTLIAGRAPTIRGTAIGSDGQPLTRVTVVHDIMGPAGGMVGMAGAGPVNTDGTFEIRDVSPGEYRLQAGARGESVSQPITVGGADLDSVTLVGSAGWALRGAIVDENGAPPPLRPTQVTLRAASLTGATAFGVQGGADVRQTVDADWTFAVANVVGPARVRVTLPEGWAVKAMLNGDQDIADLPIDRPGGQEITDLRLVITDSVATLSGQIVNETGAGLADGTVVLFPADASKAFDGSRFIRAARPDQQGRYRLSGLLPGNYLVIALDYVEEGSWNDPEYLDSLRPRALKVAIDEPREYTAPLRLVIP
jgi:hypothetical protein